MQQTLRDPALNVTQAIEERHEQLNKLVQKIETLQEAMTANDIVQRLWKLKDVNDTKYKIQIIHYKTLIRIL